MRAESLPLACGAEASELPVAVGEPAVVDKLLQQRALPPVLEERQQSRARRVAVIDGSLDVRAVRKKGDERFDLGDEAGATGMNERVDVERQPSHGRPGSGRDRVEIERGQLRQLLGRETDPQHLT